MAPRRLLLGALAAVFLGVAGVTAATAELTRPLVSGWAETVGFAAGLLTALVGVGVLLRLTSARRGDPSP